MILQQRKAINFKVLFSKLFLSLFHFLFLFTLSFSLTANVQAREICKFEISHCNLLNDESCLAKNYACGRYETIVSTLFVELFAPTLVQKYFIGASLYGLYARSRAKSLECEYAKAAKEYLEDFLIEKDLKFQESGMFGTVDNMNQVYHATQILEDLKEVEGCLESALTRTRVSNLAKQNSISGIKSFFLNPSPLAQNDLDSLSNVLRGFVSNASEVETGLALREVEIESGFRHLKNIIEIYTDIFGKVVDSGDKIEVSLDVLNQLENKSSIFLRDTEIHERNFKRALGGVSPSEYTLLRNSNLEKADQMLKESAFALDLIGLMLPSPEDSKKPLWVLWSSVNSEDDGNTIGKNLSDIKKSWKEYGNSLGHCTGPASSTRWYCL